jgi:hypothetical protein
MFVNGRHVPNETLTFDLSHEKTSVMAYKTIRRFGHSPFELGTSIIHDMFINGYFVLLDLTPDLAASEIHTSPAESGTIRIEITFKEALKKAITCLLYLEYDNSMRVDFYSTVTTDF